MVKKNGQRFGWLAIMTGIVLAVLDFLVYKYRFNDYLVSVQSEIFGAGVAFIAIGIVFVFFKTKLT